MRKIAPIRDVIHNYIAPTIFEQEIIDSPYFQRLHYVLQNSAAYSVYPCNKNSRFVHSLGVSHLCGRILIRALKNAKPNALTEFLTQANTFVLLFCRSGQDPNAILHVEETWKKRIGNGSRFHHHFADDAPTDLTQLKAKLKLKFSPECLVNTLWIALRICGLVHDIGHLPMSHEFEMAIRECSGMAELLGLKDEAGKIGEHLSSKISDVFDEVTWDPEASLNFYASVIGTTSESLATELNGLQLHERRGLRIFDKIENSVPIDLSPEEVVYRRLIFQIAHAILLSENLQDSGKNQFLAALRDVFSGELEADRLDYVARDSNASGLEIGAFDLDRIVTNFVLTSDTRLRIVPGVKSLSAIESFFHQRYLLYKTLIFHKSATRTKAVLREIIKRLICHAYSSPGHKISRLLSDSHIVEFKDDSVDILLPYSERSLRELDDSRLRVLIFDVLAILESYDDAKLRYNYNYFGIIKGLIETFLFRKTENLLSLNDPNLIIVDSCSPVKVKEAIFAARSNLLKKSEGRLVLLWSELRPRIYRSPIPGSKKEPLYIFNKNSAIDINSVSPYLKQQAEMVRNECAFATAFFGIGVKNSEKDKLLCAQSLAGLTIALDGKIQSSGVSSS